MNQRKDFYILFITRSLRLFSYGSLAVVLFLYLAELGFSEFQIGKLLTYILLGDLVITMWLTTSADRIGRKKTLVIGALLKLFTGCVFGLSGNYYLLIISGIVGVISTSGGQIGPFISVQQAALTQLKQNISNGQIATLFGWYNLFGYFSQAAGALVTGCITSTLLNKYEWTKLETYRFVMFTYAFWGFAKFVLYNCLSSKVEAKKVQNKQIFEKSLIFGIKRKSTLLVLIRLSLLFALDAFGAAFVMQSFLSYWFQKSWGLDMSTLGSVLMLVNVISGVSGLVASSLVKKIGAIQTMIFTHLPSHFFLILIPMMPNSTLAISVLLIRYCISTMDVPARQTYVATVVDSDERSAAGGITNVARSLGLSIAPLLLGKMISSPSNGQHITSYPFYLSAALQTTYDLLLTFFYVIKKNSTIQSLEICQSDSEQKTKLTNEISTNLVIQMEQAINDTTKEQS